MTGDSNLILVNIGKGMKIIYGPEGTECPAHESCEIIFSRPYYRINLSVVLLIGISIDAADISPADGNRRPLAVVPLGEEDRERTFAGRDHHFNGKLRLAFGPERQLHHPHDRLSIFLLAESSYFEVLR